MLRQRQHMLYYEATKSLDWLLQVKRWQKEQQEQAKTVGYVETMLGRRRQLPGALDRTERSKKLGHAMRAAINTPIQVPPNGQAAASCCAATVCWVTLRSIDI
jgi:DNA polymerase family A